jgi:hypothetical protein
VCVTASVVFDGKMIMQLTLILSRSRTAALPCRLHGACGRTGARMVFDDVVIGSLTRIITHAM